MNQELPLAGSSSGLNLRTRRLSADIGGLRLAVENGEQGQGWLGISGALKQQELKCAQVFGPPSRFFFFLPR